MDTKEIVLIIPKTFFIPKWNLFLQINSRELYSNPKNDFAKIIMKRFPYILLIAYFSLTIPGFRDCQCLFDTFKVIKRREK